jgi:hypothetical protein
VQFRLHALSYFLRSLAQPGLVDVWRAGPVLCADEFRLLPDPDPLAAEDVESIKGGRALVIEPRAGFITN